jgi:hypothetical protein
MRSYELHTLWANTSLSRAHEVGEVEFVDMTGKPVIAGFSHGVRVYGSADDRHIGPNVSMARTHSL